MSCLFCQQCSNGFLCHNCQKPYLPSPQEQAQNQYRPTPQEQSFRYQPETPMQQISRKLDLIIDLLRQAIGEKK